MNVHAAIIAKYRALPSVTLQSLSHDDMTAQEREAVKRVLAERNLSLWKSNATIKG